MGNVGGSRRGGEGGLAACCAARQAQAQQVDRRPLPFPRSSLMSPAPTLAGTGPPSDLKHGKGSVCVIMQPHGTCARCRRAHAARRMLPGRPGHALVCVRGRGGACLPTAAAWAQPRASGHSTWPPGTPLRGQERPGKLPGRVGSCRPGHGSRAKQGTAVLGLGGACCALKMRARRPSAAGQARGLRARALPPSLASDD